MRLADPPAEHLHLGVGRGCSWTMHRAPWGMSSGAEKDMVVAALRTGALPPLRLQGSHSVFSMDTPHRSTHCLCLVLGLFLPCSLSFHTGAPSVFHSHRHTQGTPRAPSDTGSLALRWATLFTRGEEEGWGLKLSPSPAQVKLMTQRGRVGLELRLERRQRLMVGPHYQFVFWKCFHCAKGSDSGIPIAKACAEGTSSFVQTASVSG